MFDYKKILFILALLLLIVFIIYIYTKYENFSETLKKKNTTWKLNKSCPYEVSKTIIDIMKESGIQKSDDENSDILIPCTYDDINTEIKNMDIKNKSQKSFIIKNVDNICAKEYLWRIVSNKYGMSKALDMMPNSYTLYEKDDLKRFIDEYDSNKIYILKKNIQRQEGLKITNDMDEILKAPKQNFVLVQELLQDPYLINGRKINLRVYILVNFVNNKMQVYVYNDGFMYYTAELYQKESLDPKCNITTGYIDRQVYKENPLTHKDFQKYLDSQRDLSNLEKRIRLSGQKVSDYVFYRIYKLVTDVFSAYENIFEATPAENSFILFGADVAVSDDLESKIIEVNKGPDLGAKDERDENLKKGCFRDILKIVGILNNDENGFIRLI